MRNGTLSVTSRIVVSAPESRFENSPLPTPQVGRQCRPGRPKASPDIRPVVVRQARGWKRLNREPVSCTTGHGVLHDRCRARPHREHHAHDRGRPAAACSETGPHDSGHRGPRSPPRCLIGDLLDAGRIDTGTLSVAPEPSELETKRCSPQQSMPRPGVIVRSPPPVSPIVQGSCRASRRVSSTRPRSSPLRPLPRSAPVSGLPRTV